MLKDRFKMIKGLKRLGEMCVVTTKEMIQSKLSKSGTLCLFVGYSSNHANDV
jgi:hypothetical protein